MSTVAEQLRQARQNRNLTVSQVAETTKIRSDYITALEEGNFDSFPAPVYIRGFVRTISTLLKLDVPQVMAALDAELGQSKKFSETPTYGRPRGLAYFVTLQLSKLDWRKTLIGLGVVAAGAVILGIMMIWRHHQTVDPLKDLKPGIYQPRQTNAGQTLPLPPVTHH